MTSTIETVEALLSHIQRELVVPKSRHNKFGGYNYRNCEDILDAVKKMLPEGAYLRLSDDPVMIGDWHYVKATASLSYAGANVVAFAYAREELNKKGMDAAQVTGSTSSYARKYALNGLFCIDDVQDPDAGEAKEEKVEPKKKANDDSAAKSWVLEFAQKIQRCESIDDLFMLLDESSKARMKLAQNFPHLIDGVDAAIERKEQELKDV